MRIRELLDEQRGIFYTISDHASVEDAINSMLDRKATALIVTQNDRPVGIFTGRDVLRCHAKYAGKAFGEIRLGDAMTNKLIYANAEDDVNAGISLMVQNDIKHLPVMEGGRIIGILPICDLAYRLKEHLTEELNYLQGYIADLQDAAKD